MLILLKAAATPAAYSRIDEYADGKKLELDQMFRRLNDEAKGVIDVSADALARIILLARTFAADAASASGTKEGLGRQDVSESGADLRAAIESLSADDQAILVALAWIGRGEFVPAEFDQALVMAFERQTGAASDYLMGLPMLGDLLELGAACGAELSGASSGGQAAGGSLPH
ncbi:MAG: DUF3775 domain-containing protein [Hyphomonadaceae bacterium]|nr:DUF3775 domain-containing protein [Hyphomonadaceae bacterium]